MPWIEGRFCETDKDKGVYREMRPLIRNAKDGSVFILVPGGEFEMGDGEASNSPKHRVHVDAYYLGVSCVTNRQYTQFVKESRHRTPYQSSGSVWENGRCPEEKLDHPVVCVSWDDAAAYAKWAGCALPTEAQWEKAARGLKELIYPWGNEWDQSKCRNNKNKGNEQTAMMGKYPLGVSGYGAYQQSGNVWEWCADWYGAEEYKKGGVQRNPTGPASGSYRVDRGGCWRYDDPSYFRGAARFCNIGPAYRYDYLGFRLVRTV